VTGKIPTTSPVAGLSDSKVFGAEVFIVND